MTSDSCPLGQTLRCLRHALALPSHSLALATIILIWHSYAHRRTPAPHCERPTDPISILESHDGTSPAESLDVIPVEVVLSSLRVGHQHLTMLFSPFLIDEVIILMAIVHVLRVPSPGFGWRLSVHVQDLFHLIHFQEPVGVFGHRYLDPRGSASDTFPPRLLVLLLSTHLGNKLLFRELLLSVPLL